MLPAGRVVQSYDLSTRHRGKAWTSHRGTPEVRNPRTTSLSRGSNRGRGGGGHGPPPAGGEGPTPPDGSGTVPPTSLPDGSPPPITPVGEAIPVAQLRM